MLMRRDHALFEPNSGIFELMKQKIKYLTWGCSIAMFGLTAIQGYFVYNTYGLKEKEAQNVVRAGLINMENSIQINALRKEWFSHLEELVRTNRQAAISDFVRQGSKAISAQVTAYISKNQVLSSYRTAYQVVIIKALLINQKAKYVLDIRNKPWFANAPLPDEPIFIHEISTDVSSGNDYIRGFTTRSSFSIHEGRRYILGQMLGLLIFSVVLLGLVMLLFYFSIRSLMTQKKLTDLQTDFINNITHEFNTPLATLAVAISTARDQEEDKGSTITKNAIAIMERQHLRLKKLIGQVMTHTAGAQQLFLKKENIATDSFLHNIIHDFEAANTGVELVSQLKKDSIELTGDQFYLTSAIINILENALKYGGTSIHIAAKAGEGFCQISIQDNGIGIPEGEQEKIFTKFYRVEKGDIHNTKGLGLGLYYSQQIMTAHGGHIRVESPVGKGSTFTLFLPLP